MKNITLDRAHHLSFEKAVAIAKQWQTEAENDYQMHCTETEVSHDEHCIHFERKGASGKMRTTATHFHLEVTLGFLLGTFKERIEAQLHANLDAKLESV